MSAEAVMEDPEFRLPLVTHGRYVGYRLDHVDEHGQISVRVEDLGKLIASYNQLQRMEDRHE